MEKFFKRPWLIVGIVAAITVFFAFQLPRIELDNNNYRFIPENNPARLTLDHIEDTFGNQILVLVGIDRKYDTVFEAEFIARLRAFTAALESNEQIESVQSLVTTDYITGEGGSIIAEPLIDGSFAGTDEEIEKLKRRVLSWDLYENSIVSRDLKATQVVVALDFESSEAGSDLVLKTCGAIKDLAKASFDPKDTDIYIAGLPVLSANINEAVLKDLRSLIPIVVLVVLAVLFLSFRRGLAIALPIMTVLIATLWSVGAMPLFGVKLSILSTVLPVILVAVGSAYGIHVVTHYIDDRELKGPISETEHRELVFALVRKIGKPVFLAALTTFVGFVSFCFTSVLPIREFGYFSSWGVIASFAVSMTLIPAVFLIRGPKPLGAKILSGKTFSDEPSTDPLSDALSEGLTAIAKKRRMVLLATVLVAAVSCIGLGRLVVDNRYVEYFRPNTDTVRSDEFVRERFGGSKLASVIVESKDKGGVLDPDVLAAMDGLETWLNESVPEVGKVSSFTDIVKRINQVYNADEDPSGIKPASSAPAQSAPASESSDELGSFGFGDFGSFESAGATAEETAPTDASTPDTAGPALDAASMVRALDAAIVSGDNYSLDANALVSGLRKAVNHEGASYYEIPVNPAKYGKKTKGELKEIVSNYMVLLSGDIDTWANDPLEPTAIRMNVQLRTIGQTDTDRALARIQEYVDANFPDTVKVTVGGQVKIEGALNDLVIWSQLTSVFISLLMVFIIIAVSYRSIVAGLIGIVPLSISILLNFAIMGFIGIKLNIATALVASVSVGIGVDYTIHYLEAYYRERRRLGKKGGFLGETFKSSGKAIIINACSVGAGFAVLILSQFNILAQFGLLIAFTMFSSSLIALTVLPVLLGWLKPAFLDKEI